MLPILDRYLLQEIFKALLAILLVLLLIFMGSTFIKLLQQVSVGDLHATLLFQMLGLEMFRFLARLVPPAFFFAVLFAVGRLYRDSEVTAMEACGIGGVRLLRAILVATLPVVLLVAWLSMGVAPWSARAIEGVLSDQQGQAAELAGVNAGRFNEYSRGDLIFYVESISSADRRMHNLFVQQRQADEISLISAAVGYQQRDPRSAERYLVFEEGYRYQGMPGAANYRVSEFDRYALRIQEATPAQVKRPWKSLPNSALLASDKIRDKTEFQVRLSQVLALLVVALLALPLSRSTQRQSPYGKLVLAFVVYTFYLSLQGAAEKWMADAVTPAWLGIWWVHLSMALIALTLFVPETRAYKRARRRLLRVVR
jgi:lipopolysaccharide export system permease protein